MFFTGEYHADYGSTFIFCGNATWHFREGVPLLFKTTAPFCMHQVLRLHRRLQNEESGPLDHWPNKVSPGSVLSLISYYSCFCFKWDFYFLNLLCTTSPLLSFHTYSSLLLLTRLFCNQDYVLNVERDSEFLIFPIIDYCTRIIFLWCHQNFQLNTNRILYQKQRKIAFSFLVPNQNVVLTALHRFHNPSFSHKIWCPQANHISA